MITLQRIGMEGAQALEFQNGSKIRLREGESLLLEKSGTEAIRSGADLVILVPGEGLDF